jgi:hypothetical protein
MVVFCARPVAKSGAPYQLDRAKATYAKGRENALRTSRIRRIGRPEMCPT